MVAHGLEHRSFLLRQGSADPSSGISAAVAFGGYISAPTDKTTGDFHGSVAARRPTADMAYQHRGLQDASCSWAPAGRTWDTSASAVPDMQASQRNRTSFVAFPTGGHNYRNYRPYLPMRSSSWITITSTDALRRPTQISSSSTASHADDQGSECGPQDTQPSLQGQGRGSNSIVYHFARGGRRARHGCRDRRAERSALMVTQVLDGTDSDAGCLRGEQPVSGWTTLRWVSSTIWQLARKRTPSPRGPHRQGNAVVAAAMPVAVDSGSVVTSWTRRL